MKNLRRYWGTNPNESGIGTGRASSCRPLISMTSISCKVLEHIVINNVMSHMGKYNRLYDIQKSFRTKHSCETQPVTLILELMRNILAGRQTDICLASSPVLQKFKYTGLLSDTHRGRFFFL